MVISDDPTAEQEGRERVARAPVPSSVPLGRNPAGGAAAEVVGACGRVPAVAVVWILLDDEPELPRVVRLDPGQVIGERPQVVARASHSERPQSVIREIDQREQLVGSRHVAQADLRPQP